MLTIYERYIVSTLCKPDAEAIEKTRRYFKKTVQHIKEDHPDYDALIMIGPMRRGQAHDIVVHGKTIRLCRLIWEIRGERENVNGFLDAWKRMDKNKLRSFRAEREYSLPEIARYMPVTEND